MNWSAFARTDTAELLGAIGAGLGLGLVVAAGEPYVTATVAARLRPRELPNGLRISSPYGMRISPAGPYKGTARMHEGLDLAVPQGTPVRPAAAGRVAWVRYSDDRPGGNVVAIDHGNGWRTQYAHLSAVYVQSGDPVDRGHSIGLSGGAPGTPGAGPSTGAHLHFEVRIARRDPTGKTTWVPVDPVPYVSWG